MKEPKMKPVKNRKPHEKHEQSKRSLGKAANPRSKRNEAKREKKKRAVGNDTLPGTQTTERQKTARRESENPKEKLRREKHKERKR